MCKLLSLQIFLYYNNAMTEEHIIIFLVQVFLLLGLSRLGGDVFSRYKQPALTAEIFVGILLGPTVLGRLFPQVHIALFPEDVVQTAMFETVAWLGAFFFLLEAGLEIDFSSAWRQKGDALVIAVTDIVVPMVLGFCFAWFLPDKYLVSPDQKIVFGLFMATILTVSAMPISVRALHDLNLSKTDLGFLIMSALSVNDIIGWLLFTIVLGVFIQAHPDVMALAKTFSAAAIFVVLCLTVGRHASNWVVNQIKARKLPEPASSLTFIFLLGLWCGAVAQRVGLHALFGFFLAGVVAGEAKNLSERSRQTIGQIVYALFVPLFFAGIGLKMDFLKNFDPFLIGFVAVGGIGVRFLGAWLGVSLTKVAPANRLAIAIAHTPGGMMEIVMGLVALQHHLITEKVFVSIVFGALITAVVMGPWLGWAIARRRQVSIFEFFTRRGLVVPLKVDTREQAVSALAAAAAYGSGLDEEEIVRSVMEREAMMGTAIEEGVALPHGRIAHLSKPVIIFGRCLSGVEWNSPDGKPSQFIFMILLSDKDDVLQVQILRAIARMMLSADNAQAILAAKDAAEIWGIFQNAFRQLYVQQRP